MESRTEGRWLAGIAGGASNYREKRAMAVQQLKAKRMTSKLRGSPTKGAPVAGRAREQEPDPRTIEGQWALWLRTKLPANTKADDLAEQIGVNRSTVFKWMRGEAVPHVSVWAELAKILNLPGWWSLCPPEDFIRGLQVQPRRGRK